VQRVVGEVRGQVPIVVDDMISTAGTIQAAIQALLAAGCVAEGLTVVASHGLFVGPAEGRLHAIPLHQLVVTDGVARPAREPLAVQVVSLGSLLAAAITRLHHDQSLSDLLTHR
jgi:ribose-phosphate pyrophosphokinase